MRKNGLFDKCTKKIEKIEILGMGCINGLCTFILVFLCKNGGCTKNIKTEVNKSGAYAIYKHSEMAISKYISMGISLVEKCYNNILPKIKNHAISPIVPIAIAQILRFTKPQMAIKPRITATIRNTNGGAKPWAFSSIVVIHLRSLFENFEKNSLPHHLQASPVIGVSISLFFRIFSDKFSYIFRNLHYKYFFIMRADSFNEFFPKILNFFNWSLPSPIHLDCRQQFRR